MTVKRWSKSAADETIDSVLDALKELEEHGYIVVDYDTEEVWIRTFAHHDGVCRSVKTRHPAYRQLAAVASGRLRELSAAALLAEGPPPTDWEPPDNIRKLFDVIHRSEGVGVSKIDDNAEALWITENPQVNTLCHTLSDRVCRITGFGDSPEPSPWNLEPSPPTPSARPTAGIGATHQRPQPGPPPPATVLDAAHAIADACTGHDKRTVRSEAAQVAVWAQTLDGRLIDEAIGWTRTQPAPPTLPRAIAAVIRAKAADHGITLPAFTPQTNERRPTSRQRRPNPKNATPPTPPPKNPQKGADSNHPNGHTTPKKD